MEEILDLPPKAQKSIRPASFFARSLAFLADGVILYIGSYVATGAVGRRLGLDFYIVLIIISVAYFVGMETASVQGTIGKILLRLKVARNTGEPISAGTALGRAFGKLVSGVVLGMGYLMMLWDPGKRTLHDKMTSTVVHEG